MGVPAVVLAKPKRLESADGIWELVQWEGKEAWEVVGRTRVE